MSQVSLQGRNLDCGGLMWVRVVEEAEGHGDLGHALDLE